MSLRRSSVSGGTGTRIILPSFVGFNPRSVLRMAFSIGRQSHGSHGGIVMSCGSGAITWPTDSAASASRNTPRHRVQHLDVRAPRARAASSLRKSSTAFSMRVLSCVKASLSASNAAILAEPWYSARIDS